MARHQLGILFVHGIGDQPEGDTLLAFGEPLFRWLRAWLRRNDPKSSTLDRVQVVRARLTPGKDGEPVPSHAELRVEAGDSRPPASWLVAEGWWGGEVQKPPFRRLAGWMLTVGAWTILSHATKWAAGRTNKAARVATEILALILWLPFALLLQLGVVILAALALLPIPRLRDGLSRVLLAITGVLGDSYVLVESDLQRSAIVNRTRDALRWLAAECDTVAVIAHSQGAAVAHHVLREGDPKNVGLLLTFGSGLGKLEELLAARDAPTGMRISARTGPLLLVLGALLAYGIAVGGGGTGLWFVGTTIFFSAALVLISARAHWDGFAERARGLSLKDQRPALRWIDIHASHDLVPNGELPPRGAIVPGLRSREIVNFRSLLRDHTTYWMNRCEFIPRVVAALGQAARTDFFTPPDARLWARVAAAHRRSLRWLTLARLTTLAALALLFWRYGASFKTRGIAAQQLVASLDWGILSLLGTIAEFAGGLVPFISTAAVSAIWQTVLGAAIPLVLLALWGWGYGFLWRWWDGLPVERAFRPGRTFGVADRVAVDVMVIAAGGLPLATVGFWPYLGAVNVMRALDVFVWVVYVAMFLAAVVWVFRNLARAVATRRDGRTVGDEETQELRGGVVSVISLAAFLLFLAPGGDRWRVLGFAAVMALTMVKLVVSMHQALRKRVGSLDWSPLASQLAVWGPAGLAIAIALASLAVPRIESVSAGESVADAFMVAAVTYMMLVVAVRGVIALVARLSARGRVPAISSTSGAGGA